MKLMEIHPYQIYGKRKQTVYPPKELNDFTTGLAYDAYMLLFKPGGFRKTRTMTTKLQLEV